MLKHLKCKDMTYRWQNILKWLNSTALGTLNYQGHGSSFILSHSLQYLERGNNRLYKQIGKDLDAALKKIKSWKTSAILLVSREGIKVAGSNGNFS